MKLTEKARAGRGEAQSPTTQNRNEQSIDSQQEQKLQNNGIERGGREERGEKSPPRPTDMANPPIKKKRRPKKKKEQQQRGPKRTGELPDMDEITKEEGEKKKRAALEEKRTCSELGYTGREVSSVISSTSREKRRKTPKHSRVFQYPWSKSMRPEDLRVPFEKFGPVKDVYLPRNYYTGEPRGFGFVKFRYPEDAAEAKDRLNYTVIGGREIRIVFAEENRKTPHEMRKISRTSSRHERRRSPPSSPRSRFHSYSRSPSSGRHHSRSVSRSRSSRSERDYRSSRRSVSPRERSPDERAYRARERSESPRDVSPRDEKDHKSSRRRDVSPRVENYRSSNRSPSSREISPNGKDSMSPRRSVSPRKKSPIVEGKSKQRAFSSREVSPRHEAYRSNERPISSRDLSPVNERGGMSRHGSLSPKKKEVNPGWRDDLASRSSRSPRRKARSVSRSCSRSRSYSPR